MENKSPSSNQEAINRANSDAQRGGNPANTTGWNNDARVAYETQVAWAKKQQS